MANLPADRTTANTPTEHVDDHNTLHAFHNLVDAKGDLIVGTAADTAGKLSVGTNGHILTADSTVAGGIKWAAASSGSSVPVVAGTRTSGNVTLNGVGWGNVDTGLDLTIPAVVGDWIEVSLSGRLAAGAANTHTFFDIAFVAGGSVTNHFSLGGTGGGGDEGLNGLRIKDTTDGPLTGTFLRQTEAADVSGGNVIVRLRYRQDTAGNRLFVAGATNPFKWWVKNLG